MEGEFVHNRRIKEKLQDYLDIHERMIQVYLQLIDCYERLAQETEARLLASDDDDDDSSMFSDDDIIEEDQDMESEAESN